MKTKLYNQQGEELREIDLPDEIFGLKISDELLHQAYLAQKNNSRVAIANTKTRKEVRGGGKKPWKQKGTGRARHSSIRSPLWRGGGITFGPTNERNFSEKINKKMKRAAILMALSSKVVSGELIMVDDIRLDEIKTKAANAIVKNLPIKNKALIVQAEKSNVLIKSFRNIPRIKTILANSLNVADLLETKYLVLTEPAINSIKNIFVLSKQ